MKTENRVGEDYKVRNWLVSVGALGEGMGFLLGRTKIFQN